MSAISASSARCKTMEKVVDITGKTFGMLTVTSFNGIKNRRAMWNCVCSCGSAAVKQGASIRSGATASCGCRKLSAMQEARKTNGARRSTDASLKRFYSAWCGMKARCRNQKHKDFRYYGALGIDVCERWNSFENFKADMWPRPDGMTLDRKDPTKGYEPGNCRWATALEQRHNRRNNNGGN